MTITRRQLLEGTALAAASVGGVTLSAQAHAQASATSPRGRSALAKRRPNVLVIVLDDVGFADLGCYGSELATPAIDGLAARGLRFNNFHTAPLCSPTRASLLTGCNPHAAGMGTITDWADTRPGYRGRVPAEMEMLPALLAREGYGCYAAGKWHLNRPDEQGAAGPFDNWPTRRGFDRWYGFHGPLTDQWHPELFEGTSAVDAVREQGYHLTSDLVDRMISFLGDHVTAAPERPFFAYLALGACHWPLQVPEKHTRKLKGKFDGGWTRTREARFRRQKQLGIVPADTRLPQPDADIPAWDGMAPAARAFAARCMEVYGAFVEHTDQQIGRILAALNEFGVGEDTMIVLLSDNGATAEAGHGSVDFRHSLYIAPETAAEQAAALDQIGSELSFPAYPAGWAAAGNTPFKWYKSTAHEGGVRTPLIVSWPGGGVGDGSIRQQFHHVSDIAPTICEIVGIDMARFEGSSFAYLLQDARQPTVKTHQLFEAAGSRALWHKGWKAVARHMPNGDFDADRWELYNTAIDFSEADDLAQTEAQRLGAMISEWHRLAGAGQILPLGEKRDARFQSKPPPPRRRFTIHPSASRVERLAMPDVFQAHRMAAHLDLRPGAQGVVVAAGSALRGYELFIKDGRLTYVYVSSRHERVELSVQGLPLGPCTVTVEMTDGRRSREVRLLVDGREGASGRIAKSWPIQSATAGLRCGRNRGAPVSRAYGGEFAFTGGEIRRIDFELEAS